MSQISSLYSKGIESIYNTDLEQQKKYINVVGTMLRKISIETFTSVNAFYVPNGEYMKHHFGPEIALQSNGCYLSDSDCIWQNYLMFPMTDILGNVVGFAGFDPINYTKAKESDTKEGLNYYSYTTKNIVKKGNYIYSPKDGLMRAIEDGYMCIVDGLFDCLSLYERGFNAGALLSSSITENVIAQLRFVEKLIVISDNDKAGVSVVNILKRHHSNVVWLKQGMTKDVDALLKTEYEDVFISKLKYAIENNVFDSYKVEFKNLKFRSTQV